VVAHYADAQWRELGGQISGECLFGGLRWAVASTNGMPSREWVAVTVMMTPDSFGTIRRAARRAVRKYEVARVLLSPSSKRTIARR
jgi:hypothetical protein